MDNVTDLKIKDNPLKMAWGENNVLIVKTVGRENRTISLSIEEANHLYEMMTEQRQMWTDNAS